MVFFTICYLNFEVVHGENELSQHWIRVRDVPTIPVLSGWWSLNWALFFVWNRSTLIRFC